MQATKHSWGAVLAAASILHPANSSASDGHILHGVGSVNQAMGGAGIATSIDAIGSNYNNVSSIAFLSRSAVEFGVELFIPDRNLSSSLPGFGGGTVDSKTRESVLPNLGLAYKTGGPWTFGFTALGIGGFGVDYPSSLPGGSPISLPQPYGLGAIYSNYQLLQLTPSVAYQATENLALGVGFNLDWASLAAEPWPLTTPNASGYPSASHAASAWGEGFTLGAVYRPLPNLSVGVSFKSPQWFSDFNWNLQYPDKAPGHFSFRLDYPMIVGVGLSYRPVDDFTLAADLKWINYKDTAGFQASGFAATPRGPYVRGFGWDNIWTFALGGQYRLNSYVTLRGGYNYSDNPIPSSQQFFNIFTPAIVQHHITVGAGFNATPDLELNIAYYHAFQKTKSGPFISNGSLGYPLNQAIPGGTVTNQLSENSFSAQIIYRF